MCSGSIVVTHRLRWDLSSQTRDWTLVPCIARRLLTTGPAGKSQTYNILFYIWPLVHICRSHRFGKAPNLFRKAPKSFNSGWILCLNLWNCMRTKLERLPIILKFFTLDKWFLGHFLINITLWKHIQFHLFCIYFMLLTYIGLILIIIATSNMIGRQTWNTYNTIA